MDQKTDLRSIRHIDHVTFVARRDNERSFLGTWVAVAGGVRTGCRPGVSRRGRGRC
jgi:hypothetical protein